MMAEPALKPSEQKPWLQFFTDEAKRAELPKESIYQHLVKVNAEHRDTIAIRFVNNQITYGLKDVEQPCINVILGVAAGDVSLTFEDNGIAFDPLSQEAKERSEVSEGGYGIMLVRTFSDDQRYERTEGQNRLTIRKRMLGE